MNKSREIKNDQQDIVVYDVNRLSLEGLCKHFEITEEDYFDASMQLAKKGIQMTTNDFFDAFGISEEKVLEKEIYLAAFHTTTCYDGLASVKQFGLMDLREVLTKETPLCNYLKSHGVVFDLEKMILHHNEKELDISMPFQATFDPLDFVIFKLTIDPGISAFYSHENVLEYKGNVHERPEFLKNLAALLDCPAIENEWKGGKETFVIQFKAKLSDYEKPISDTPSYWDDLDERDKEFLKRRSVIVKTIENQWIGYKKEGHTQLKPSVAIPSRNFIKVFAAEEYLKAYVTK